MDENEIIDILHRIEEEMNIEILYACEAGSRVWGFAGEKSDYDMRFIYKKANFEDYLTLNQSDDMIECNMGELDIIGWDIKKALKLHYKDNPTLREWILSNQVYIDLGIDNVFTGLGGFNMAVLKNYYASIALKHWGKYCEPEIEYETVKKYLYILRAILCWRLLENGIDPPINITELVNHEHIGLDKDIKVAICELIESQQKNVDLSKRTLKKLFIFMEDSLSEMKTEKAESVKKISDYDVRFREIVL